MENQILYAYGREISVQLHCDYTARKCEQAEQLQRSDTLEIDACSTRQRRQILLSMQIRQQACSTVSVRRGRLCAYPE